MAEKGLLIVVSSPSGGGKGSILRRVRASDSRLVESVSATTRPPREGEVDGQHYFFVPEAEFRRGMEEGRFVEYAEVHGNLYGTPKRELDALRAAGNDVVLELDVQGMRSVKRLYDDVVSIFIMPPSLEELERRIRVRGGMPDDQLRIRMRNAIDEMASASAYDHVINNDDLDEAVVEFRRIIEDAREKTARGEASRK